MNNLTHLFTLNSANNIVAECNERLKHGEAVRVCDDCIIPLAHTIDIYTTRARINEKRGGRVEGYEILLPALAEASVGSVKVHSLEFLSVWFVAFTDESVSNLFGLLKSPKEKEVWFDPVKGYEE